MSVIPHNLLHITLGLLQGWLDVGAIGHFIAVVLHLGWTFNLGLLFVNLYFYIFNQQRFRADTATIPALQASPARCVQPYEHHH
jgi:nicotinamide riboside transporter PnuC